MNSQNQSHNKIRYVGTQQRTNETTEKAFSEICNLEGVNKLVVFPDYYLKDKYLEVDCKASVPSSIAIKSDCNTVYPKLGFRGISCGMMIIATGIIIEDIMQMKESLIKHLPEYLSNNIPLKGSLKDTFTMSGQDTELMSKEGTPWICEQLNLNKDLLKNFNHGESFFTQLLTG